MPRISQKLSEAQDTWEEKIQRAKKVRKNWKDLFRVDMLRDYIDGKQNPGYPAAEWITINKLYSHLKAQLPSLYAADPYFYVKLHRSFSPHPLDIALFEKKAKIRQSYINYIKNEINLKEKARLSILDGHFAYGVAKVHYKADMKENPDAGQPIKSEEDENTALLGDDGEQLIEPEEIPIDERYCVTRIHPDDFLWDEDAGPLPDDWHWVAQCIRMPLEEAKRDKRFNRAALKAVENKGETQDDETRAREDRKKGGDVKGRSEKDRKDKKEKKEDQVIVTWEIYEIAKKKWHCIVEGGDAPLFHDEPYPKGVEDHPFAILRFFFRDDSPYPHPPLSPGIDPQKEYNLARSRVLTHRKRFNRKYEVFMTGLSSEDEASKLESGEDGTFIRKQISEPVVTPIQDAPLDQMGYMEIGYLEKDMIDVLGGTFDETRGLAGAESATQASIMDKRLEMKEGDAMSMVVDFSTTIARKLDQLVQAHITRDEAVKVTGPQGEFWELVRVDDYQEIQGEFQYSVNAGATIPRMPHVERAQWMAFLTLLSQFPQLMLSANLMKRMAEMHHIEDEAMLEQLLAIAKQMMSGQLPMPGGAGSQAGVPGMTSAATVTGGQAGGVKSLQLPGAGNIK